MKKEKFLLVINLFWAIPIVFFIRVANYFKKITIIKIRSDRIGHFATDGAEQVARFQNKEKKIIFFIFDWHICNKQWKKMLSNILPVYNLLRYVYFWNEYIPGSNSINQTGTRTESRDIDLLYNENKVNLQFDQKDNLQANKSISRPYFGMISTPFQLKKSYLDR